VARAPDVVAMFAPLRQGHEAFIELVRKNAVVKGSVVLVDLTATLLEVAGKFVTYALYPESAYSVLVTRGKAKHKISIGYNPWSKITRRHNIAEICERYGGGGHPVVGAISLGADKLDEARQLAQRIADELAT
jgi:nanoRNase/pAp phosphatase (c-di-AMP/oligoRNAs hydrolase)